MSNGGFGSSPGQPQRQSFTPPNTQFQDSMRGPASSPGGVFTPHGDPISAFRQGQPITNGGAPAVSDPYRNFGQQPTDGSGQGFGGQPYTGGVGSTQGMPYNTSSMDSNQQALGNMQPSFGPSIQNPTSPTTTAGMGQVTGANGQTYADRNSSPRAYTGGAFNPAANQWGDYSQREGDGLWGTDAQGINRVNGHVFAPSGLTSGNNDFNNWLQRFGPQFAQQNGPINQGQAYVGAQGPAGPQAGNPFTGGTDPFAGRNNPFTFNRAGSADGFSGINSAQQFDPFGRISNPFFK